MTLARYAPALLLLFPLACSDSGGDGTDGVASTEKVDPEAGEQDLPDGDGADRVRVREDRPRRRALDRGALGYFLRFAAGGLRPFDFDLRIALSAFFSAASALPSAAFVLFA